VTPQRLDEPHCESAPVKEGDVRLRRLAGKPFLHIDADIAKSRKRHVVSILDHMYILNEPAYRLVVGLYHNETFESLYLDLSQRYPAFRTRAQLQEALDQLAPSMFAQTVPSPVKTSLRFFALMISPDSVRKLGSLCKWLFSLPAFICAMSVSVFILNDFRERVGFTPQNFSARTLIWATPLLLLGALIHEIGHATASHRFGASSGGIGIAISSACLPSFYVDVTPAWTLSRSQRLLVDVSGCYFQLLFALCCFVFVRVSESAESVLICSAVLNLSAVAVNLLPIFELDGYWVLVDLLNAPNLQEKTLISWKAWLRDSNSVRFTRAVIIYSVVLCLSLGAAWISLWSMVRLLLSQPGNLHYSTFFTIFLLLSSLLSLVRMGKWGRKPAAVFSHHWRAVLNDR
jgi:hypothetical protein